MTRRADIAVIGSNSFSGQDFVSLALDDPDIRVIGFSRSAEPSAVMAGYKHHSGQDRFQFVQADLNKNLDLILDTLEREKPRWIVNFAAQSEVGPSWDHPEHWMQTNTVSLARLVKSLSGVDWLDRYLHVSSPEAYGSCEGRVTEETPDNPTTPYAVSKSAADMLIDVYRRQFNFPASFVRATNVYGPRQQLFKIIPRSIIRIRNNETIHLHGGGTAEKSYIHVRDVSRGEMAILEHGDVGKRYHLSPSYGAVSIRDLVSSICDLMGVPFDDRVEAVEERPGQDKIYLIDSSRARGDLGWKDDIVLKDGLRQCIDWVDENWSVISTLPHEYQHKA